MGCSDYSDRSPAGIRVSKGDSMHAGQLEPKGVRLARQWRVAIAIVEHIGMNEAGRKTLMLTPDPLRAQIVMTIQPSTQKPECALSSA